MRGKALICLLMLVLPGSPWAQTHLTGVALYQQLSKDYYLAALYTSSPMSDVEAILADTQPQKMVLKVTAKRWSLRSFEKVWRQDLSLNNDLSRNLKLTQAISQFIAFPRQALARGDELVIEFTRDQQTLVSLNKARVMSEPGKQLFNALLNTWLGEVPPSRLFKADLLGAEALISSARELHVTEFSQLSIAPEREDIVQQWRAEEQRLLAVQQKAARERELKKQQAEALRIELAQAKARQERQKQQSTEQQSKQAKAEAESQQQITEQDKQQTAELGRLAAEAELQQYMVELYQWQVANAVAQEVEYPQWALEFNLQGQVSIEFIVAKDGQLLGISNISPQNSGLLGQALQSGLTQAAPFSAFSDRLDAQELVLKLDYQFSPELSQPVNIEKPQAPENLQQLIAAVG